MSDLDYDTPRGHDGHTRSTPGPRTGTPGRSTVTARMPPSARSIARAVAAELRGDNDVHDRAAAGVRGAGEPLPHLAAIQQSFGHHDVTGIGAHVGGAAADAAAAIGARAYATGDDVAFAAAPDLHTAAHEAAHVVQQRGGIRLAGGVGQAGDPFELHADAVADRVVRGESAQALLDTMAHRGSAGGPAVQRSPVVFGDDAQALARLEQLLRAAPGDADAISAEQAEAILQQLDAPATPSGFAVLPTGGPRLHFTVGTDEYSIQVPPRRVDHVRSLAAARVAADDAVGECSEAGATSVPHVVAGGARIAHVTAGPGLVEALTAGIGAIGGAEGDELEFQFAISVPISAGLGTAEVQLDARIAHEPGEGAEHPAFVVAGRLEGGAGLRIPEVAHARLMVGVGVEARGHDAAAAAQMLVLAIDHALADFCPPLADAMCGRNAEAHALAAAEEGDYADAYEGFRADAGVEAAGPAGGGAEVSAGVDTHRRETVTADGTETMHYRQFDLHASAELHASEEIAYHVAFDAHIAPHSRTARAPDDEMGFSFRVSHEAGAAAIGLGAIVGEALAFFHDHVGDHPGAVAAVREGQTASARLASLVDRLVTAAVMARAHHAEGGVLLEVEVTIVPEPDVTVRIVEELSGALPLGVAAEVEMLTEVPLAG